MKLAGSGRTQSEFGRDWNPSFAERRRSDMFKFPWARFPLNARLRPVRKKHTKQGGGLGDPSGQDPDAIQWSSPEEILGVNFIQTPFLHCMFYCLFPKIPKILVNRFPFGSKKIIQRIHTGDTKSVFLQKTKIFQNLTTHYFTVHNSVSVGFRKMFLHFTWKISPKIYQNFPGKKRKNCSIASPFGQNLSV